MDLSGFVRGFTERLLAVLLAVGAAQFPLYYDAYVNTVAGAQHEAQLRYHELEREAAALHLSIDSFIVRHEVNPDAVFQASGRMHRTTVEHYTRYSAMLKSLRGASVWSKPLRMQQNFDRELFRAAHFTPGLPLSIEGGVWALAGMLLAWLISAIADAILNPRRFYRV